MYLLRLYSWVDFFSDENIMFSLQIYMQFRIWIEIYLEVLYIYLTNENLGSDHDLANPIWPVLFDFNELKIKKWNIETYKYEYYVGIWH